MAQRVVMVANAIVSGLFGLGFLLAANSVLGLYGGMSMEPATDQLFGGALIGLALLNLFARDVASRDAQRAIFLGNFAYNAIALAAIAPGLSGTGNGLAWLTVALTVIFTVAFGYLLVIAFRAVEPGAARAG